MKISAPNPGHPDIPKFPQSEAILESLRDCALCPRSCHVDRLSGQTGYCGQTGALTAARAALHHWEEPCISGSGGSGTVFFCGCNLQCIFCQNRAIAQGQTGRAISIGRLAEIFLELQEKGAHNINLVTPTHNIPQILLAIRSARDQGLRVPIVYNTGSYEKVESLRMLDGSIDIYLPDLKYFSSDLSFRYSHAADYFEKASAAIAEMFRQTGVPVFDGDLLKRGVIVRHLLLPGQARDSKKILRYLRETYGDTVLISIMNQYTPLSQVSEIPELNRPVSDEEYQKILKFAEQIGITRGFIQEGETALESFIPPFDGTGLQDPYSSTGII